MVEAKLPDPMYVERDEERQHYLDFLAQDTPWILLFTGMGGSGKTHFLNTLKRYTPPTCKLVTLDFYVEDEREDALTVLRKIAGQIKPYCDAQSYQEFEGALKEGRKTLASDQLQIFQQANFGEYSQTQGVRLDLAVEASKAKIRQVRSQVAEAFYNLLETFRLSQLVIILDTCELLDEKEGRVVGEWLKKDLLPHIHTLLQEKQCRCSVVAASSIPMSFANSPGSTQPLNLDHIPKTEVDDYLQRMGVEDPRLRQYIYSAITYGHASCIEVLARIWSEKGPFRFEERAKLHSLFKQKAWRVLYDRVLEKFEHSPLKELVHYGVLLRSFDLPLLRIVFSGSLPASEALSRFQKLILYPFIREYSSTHHAFIDLMREILVEAIRYQETIEWRYYHGLAMQELQTKSRVDWHYHALSCDEVQGMREWQQAVEKAYRNADRERLSELLEVANDKTLKLSAPSCAERAYEQGRYYTFCQQKDNALASYRQALALFQSIHDATGEAKARQAIDRMQQG